MQFVKKSNLLAQQTSDTNHITNELNSVSQAQTNRKRAKIVTVPASSLTGLTGILSPGYEGNALADAEALHDDVNQSTIPNASNKLYTKLNRAVPANAVFNEGPSV